MRAAGGLDARDDTTATHSEAVAQLAAITAHGMGLAAAAAANAADVALVHDVGKMGIPDAILYKRGALTDRDWQVMRLHPEIGERILASVAALSHLAPAVRAEHERWDGGGYPDGLRGQAIPRASRIVLACDAYQAMISDRPYRAAMPPDDAVVELQANAGSQFDPEVVCALVSAIRRDGDGAAPSIGSHRDENRSHRSRARAEGRPAHVETSWRRRNPGESPP